MEAHVARMHQCPEELLCFTMSTVLEELGYCSLKFDLIIKGERKVYI